MNDHWHKYNLHHRNKKYNAKKKHSKYVQIEIFILKKRTNIILNYGVQNLHKPLKKTPNTPIKMYLYTMFQYTTNEH